jgi:ribosomal protein S18 acetylase RimI-like enzyme
VSVSEFHRNWAIKLGICGPRRILAIPNGVTEAARNHEVDLPELRRQLGARPCDLLILSIARLASDKGLEYLIQAAATLPVTGRRIRTVIAGDGPERERLERLTNSLGVTDRVTFTGFREDVGDLLAACDLVILPSFREGLSISLLQAMAAGRPIIATTIGSQKEVASHAEMALLVPPADAPALREAILRLARDPELMNRLGANARAVYESFYTETRMLRAYWQLYIDLLRANCALEANTAIRSSEKLLPVPSEQISPAYTGAIPHHYPRGTGSRRRPLSQVQVLEAVPHIDGGTNKVRKATANDLAGIVTIHQQAFDNFFTTRLGAEFLRKYYSLVLNYHLGIMLVSEGRQSALEGFACGFVDPPSFYNLMWHAKLEFALPVLKALVHHPPLISKVVYGVQRIHSPAAEWPEQSCELSSIAVSPETSGNGFGKGLIRAFLVEAQSMRARCVYLTTDAEGNDAANAFYRNIGFQHTRRFLQHEGRWMNEYVIDGLEANRDREFY